MVQRTKTIIKEKPARNTGTLFASTDPNMLTEPGSPPVFTTSGRGVPLGKHIDRIQANRQAGGNSNWLRVKTNNDQRKEAREEAQNERDRFGLMLFNIANVREHKLEFTEAPMSLDLHKARGHQSLVKTGCQLLIESIR